MQIHIEFKLTGDGFPNADELRLRHELEDWILDRALGDIVDAGAGRGVMDIYVETSREDAQRQIEQHLAARKTSVVAKVRRVEDEPR